MSPIGRMLIALATLAAGCQVGVWSWSSDSGSHELAFPPSAAAPPTATPEPTPLSRY